MTRSLVCALAILCMFAPPAAARPHHHHHHPRPVRGSSTDGDLRPRDEQLLAAYLPGALAAFPAPQCAQRVVHLYADAAIRAAYPADPNVKAMTDGCEVYMASRIPRWIWREALYHEMAHTAGWQHSAAMDQAVADALRA